MPQAKGAGDNPRPRRYIRHPSHVPIRFDLGGMTARRPDRLRNVSEGGLCFATANCLPSGRAIRVVIPLLGREFEVDGVVAWCRAAAEGFEVGVRFASQQDRFTARMVEQLAYIEEYRLQVEREEGRQLSAEQAAREWIERFAGRFPGQA